MRIVIDTNLLLSAFLWDGTPKRLIEAVTLGDSVQHWITTLDGAGVPTGRVQNMAQAMADPQVQARHMILPVTPRAGGPAFVAAGNPIKMSTLPERHHRGPAPALDGDRKAILDWLDQP